MLTPSSTRKRVGKIGKCISKGCSRVSFKPCVKCVTKRKRTLKTMPVELNGKWLNAEGVNFHPLDNCTGRFCVIHRPSNHHMKTWDKYIRFDKYALIERICPKHRVGHPDPDSLAYFKRHGAEILGVHACCGCCQPEEIKYE